MKELRDIVADIVFLPTKESLIQSIIDPGIPDSHVEKMFFRFLGGGVSIKPAVLQVRECLQQHRPTLLLKIEE